MNEEPKSIWKKSSKGWRGLLMGWFFLSAALLIIFLIWVIASGIPLVNSGNEFQLAGVVWIAVTSILLLATVIRWLCSWRNFKRLLFGCACLATLIALFYAEENWRGKHDWKKFRQEWGAKGEKFDWQSIVPPRVPDEQNFAMAPIWVESIEAGYGSNVTRQWYGIKLSESEQAKLTNRLEMEIYHAGANAYTVKIEPPKAADWQKSELTDLRAWQSYYRLPSHTNQPGLKSPDQVSFHNTFPVAPQPQSPAQDVLLALSKYNPALEKLHQASELPYSRFPLNYDEQPPASILLPHLAVLKRCSQILQLRALAKLQDGQIKTALADVRLSLRLAEAIHSEPFFISHLVRIAVLQITLQPIYEGLAEHQWSDAQLAELNAELTKLDFLADYKTAIRGERGLEIANIEFFKHPRELNLEFKRPRFYFFAPFFPLVQLLSNISGSGADASMGNFSMLALGVGPSGWLTQNELRLARFDTEWYLPIVDEEAKTVSPARSRAADDAIGQEIRHRTPENVLEALLIPALGSGAAKFARAQSAVNLARTAIALERYRLAHGEFPKLLDALAPQFIEQVPHDVIGGKPLHYRRTNNGQFVLYSVGWNETDDGGEVVLGKGSSPNADIHQGDWVWRYPQK